MASDEIPQWALEAARKYDPRPNSDHKDLERLAHIIAEACQQQLAAAEEAALVEFRNVHNDPKRDWPDVGSNYSERKLDEMIAAKGGALARHDAELTVKLREKWGARAIIATQYPLSCSHGAEPDYCACCRADWEKSIAQFRQELGASPGETRREIGK